MDLYAIAKRHAVAGWRHRWKALALSWLVCVLGWTAVQLLPNQYVAHARIYADPDALLGAVLRGIAIDPTPVGQVEILQRTLLSRPNIARIIANTGLAQHATTPAAQEALIQQLSRDIRLMPSTRNLFAIEYRAQNPQTARDVVQAVLTLFVDAATSTDRRQMENARNFIASQIATYEHQLREAERRRAEFQAQYNDLLAVDGNIPRLDAIRGRMQQLRGELEDAVTRRDLLRRQAAEAPTPAQRSGNGQAAEAQRRLRELRLRYTEEHPDVIAARNLAAALRSAPRPADTGSVAARPQQDELAARLVDADALVASLERQMRDAEAELERLSEMARNAPGVQAEFISLDRDYTVMRRNYEELLARRESIQIGEAARTNTERAKVEIIDPPALPTVPVAPNRRLLAGGVLLAGLAAGLGLAVLLVQLDGSIYTLGELKRIGLPVLGVISDAEPPRRAADTAAFAGAIALLLLTYGGVVTGGRIVARFIA